MDSQHAHLAIDLGAASGRVILGVISHTGSRLERRSSVELAVVHRFPNPVRRLAGHERWNVQALLQGIQAGMQRAAGLSYEISSIGIDTWGVDYGLVDANGTLLEDPICYRDARTQGVPEQVLARVPAAELFATTGVQVQPYNTLFQLWSHVHKGRFPEQAAGLLFMPDLLHALLCDSQQSEVTIASTSQMLDVRTRDWARPMLERLGLPTAILPRLVPPGTRLALLSRTQQKTTGLGAIPIVVPASHDTASAVVGAQLEPGEAFVSSGTWSLVGVVTDAPVTTEAARTHNLSNEAGACGKTRLLQNVMGLWIVDECRRIWDARDLDVRWERLLPRVAEAKPDAGRIAVDDPRFFHPADMVAEINAALRESGQPTWDEAAQLVRIVLESLAMRYAEVLRGLEAATGRRIHALRIVGGGSKNDLLNQLTADACKIPVLAGPEEATALGNVLVQASAFGDMPHVSLPTRRFEPRT